MMYRLLSFIGALTVLLVLAMVTGFQPLYWLVYVLVGGAAVGYLLAWLQSRGLETYVDELSPHPQVGQSIGLNVVVREKAGLPRIGLRARLAGDFATTDEKDFSLRPRGTTTWTVSTHCRRRGLNTVGPLAIVASDPFGLLRQECRIGRPQSILVYPATIELPRAGIEGQAGGGEMGGTGGLPGHSPIASMVRQYVPGDSPTRIHWPTTARLDQLMTKEFEGASIKEIWLFLDLQEALHAGSGDDGTEEYSITIASSLVKNLVEQGHAVGLVTQGDRFYRLAPSKEPDHLWTLLRALALVKGRGSTPIQALVMQEADNLEPGAVAVVIGPGTGREISNLSESLARRGVPVLAILLDTVSFGNAHDPRWVSRGRPDMQEWALVVRRGDELTTPLRTMLDRLSSY